MDKSLKKFIYLSIAAAVITISLKSLAYFLTGSVGLLSDAMESIVNLVAAIIALYSLYIAEKPPDEKHAYGHTKAEYFSSIAEGILIFIASISITYAAVERLLHPAPLGKVSIGLAVAIAASLINLFIGIVLLKAGKKYQSIVLEADAHHLFTDVWTSVGVVIAVFIVSLTGLNILDPIIALLVAVNILFTGYKLIKRSMLGFMDTALEDKDMILIKEILKKYTGKNIKSHALRTRQSGRRKFLSFHLLVPGNWTIKKGHDLAEEIEKEIASKILNISILIHTESINDPASDRDISIERTFN